MRIPDSELADSMANFVFMADKEDSANRFRN